MVFELLDYVKNMFHTVKKQDVLKTLDVVMTCANDDVIPTLNEMIKNADMKAIKDNDTIGRIMKLSNIKASDKKDFLQKLKSMYTSIVKSNKQFTKLVENEFSDVVTNLTITAKDAAIMKVISDIGSMNSYILDLSYTSLTSPEESDLPKIKFKQVNEGVSSFISAVEYYSSGFSKIVNDLAKVGDVKLNVQPGKESFLEKLIGKAGKRLMLPSTSGFTGNPIYHIRMWMVDREMEKYEALKDKRKLIELKLMELKLRERDEPTEKLRKQIEYYENKISKIDYEISQIENS